MSKNKTSRFNKYVKSETFQVEDFSVTVRQIPHGEYLRAQQEMIGQMKINQTESQRKRELDEKVVDPVIFSDHVKMLAISSWTLKDDEGKDVTVDLDAWYELPHFITEQIEKVIDRLNPTLDADFRDGLGSDSATS